MQDFYSNGKLLLTGEYVVLDGANSLAIPTKFGQSLVVNTIEDSTNLVWKSLDENDAVWFQCDFNISKNKIEALSKKDNPITIRLIQILNATKKLNPDFLNNIKGRSATTKVDFPKNWGLGTSSTLINNIANWAKVDAYALLQLTFGGSGYDIACASNNNPITFKLDKNKKQSINQAPFNPPFKNDLYFVYLNKKQDSREGISQYRKNTEDTTKVISEIDQITEKMIACTSLTEFEILIKDHESIISKIINQKTVKELFFKDFKGVIKSLGAWGGDFVLVTSKSNPRAYFESKGFKTVLGYDDMILSNTTL